MRRTQAGFTLVELMIVVVIIGVLAAIAIPNFITMQDRAKEGSTKANMHTFQLAAEDICVQNDGTYATTAGGVVPGLPSGGISFKNPFDRTPSGVPYATQTIVPGATTMTTGVTTPGTTVYGGVATQYMVAGRGKTADLPLILTSGQ